jgi:2-polyprenyl-3-methyl-5-hydroxy-6-metoxy-1,4-benzoquinol methylase
VTFRESVLGSAAGYRLFKVATRGDRTMRRMVDEYVHPVPGERILDVGCGYGDLAMHVSAAEYVGIDINERYIRYAQSRGPRNTEFVLGSVTDLSEEKLGRFDCGVAIGVLHHLDDDAVTTMLAALSKMIQGDGRFIAAEPVWDPAQRTTARVLAALDRGRFVREASAYEHLITPWFPNTSVEIRHDLFWFPYTHCMIEARLES